jgi:AAA family ATP:ADP antiporter
MRGPRAWLSRYWDIRAGEGRLVMLSFVALLLIVSAHTILETARDALLLTRLPPRQLGVVYIAVAAVALPVAAFATGAVRKLGARVSLTGSLTVSAIVVAAFFTIRVGSVAVIALYVATGAIISAVVPQFWTLLEGELTTAQARRLVSPITSAGIVGGVLGSAAAAAALVVVRVKALLVLSSLTFILAAAVVVMIPLRSRPTARAASATKTPMVTTFVGAVREEPFLRQVALVVTVSTATLLALDYFFKWTVARTVPHDEVGMLVARVYAALNVASLVLQLLFGSALVRRVGLAAAITLTPLLLLLGAGGAFALGGALVVVIILKSIDGSLRYSVHRITTELLYLPIRADLRARAKPLIDGALMRTVQAATAGVLLGISGRAFLSPRLFAAIVVGLAFVWTVTAIGTRRPYMSLLRRTVVGSAELGWSDGADPLDLATAEVLVEFLARDNPSEVLAAIDALHRRGHDRLIPALILHHEDERVLVSALALFGASQRTDWHTLARRLLDRPREPVRMAAARALAMHGKLEITRLAGDPSARVEAYATLYTVLAGGADPTKDARVAALLRRPGAAGESARLGLLAALADAPVPTERVAPLLVALTQLGPTSSVAEWTVLVAQSTTRHLVVETIPLLIARLPVPTAREEVLCALVALGDPALDAGSEALRDRSTERQRRAQLPNLLARFASKRAAALLLESVENESDHLVRYRSIRALGRVAADTRLRMDRARVERQAYIDLTVHFEVLACRVALDVAIPQTEPADARRRQVTGILLRGLLDDKLRHSIERTFRLLKIAHATEDIHRVQIACLSDDLHSRANAGEFLDALLVRRDQQRLRALLRLISDSLSPAERVRRAAPLLGQSPPQTHDEALRQLVDGANTTLAALAAQHAFATGGVSLLVVDEARARRPDIDLVAARLFENDGDDDSHPMAPRSPMSAAAHADGERHGG